MPEELPYRYVYDQNWRSRPHKNAAPDDSRGIAGRQLLKIILIYGALLGIVALHLMGVA